MRKKGQVDKIIAYLANGKNSITVSEARKKFGTQKLTSRICDIRVRGFDVVTFKKPRKNGRSVTAYRLPYKVDLTECTTPYHPAAPEAATIQEDA